MPITLACPSCTKRFRARDESAGKRVKCPFCQAAVTVPDEAPGGGSSADRPAPPSDFAPPAPARPVVPPPPPPPAREPALFDVVGRPAASSGTLIPKSPDDLPPLPPPPREPDVTADAPPRPARPPKPATPAKVRPAKPARPAVAPEEAAASGWRGVKRGLFWVRFGLFWFALLGMVPFGVLVYERFKGEPLPEGPGADWVKVDGYLNTPGPDAVQLTQRELILLVAYGLPAVVGGLGIVLGRLMCGSAPRNSGARGLFACGGLLALVGFAGLATYQVCTHVREFKGVSDYGWLATLVGVGLSEFWFLLALGAAAATLRRPAAVRAVGGHALVFGLAVVLVWAWSNPVGGSQSLADRYRQLAEHHLGRPAGPDPGWQFGEAGAAMLGWLIVVGMYWRAVGGVRQAARDHLRDAQDAAG